MPVSHSISLYISNVAVMMVLSISPPAIRVDAVVNDGTVQEGQNVTVTLTVTGPVNGSFTLHLSPEPDYGQLGWEMEGSLGTS